jgi:hypothetical protein
VRRWAPLSVAALALAALTLALGLVGCGSAAAPPPGPTVTLKLTAPADGSRVSATVATVSGMVIPARQTRVDVLGHGVAVTPDGSFSAQVALAVGTNLIDVVASAPRSAGAVTAVRIVRFLQVTVPQLSGLSPSHATSDLQALGLTVKVNGSSDPFGFLIPGSTSVCYSKPAAGTKVDPGATVTIKTSKICGL